MKREVGTNTCVFGHIPRMPDATPRSSFATMGAMSTTRERPGKEQESPPKLDLTVTQVVASSLAAVSAAVASSKLGVGGTIMGAAAASVVATIGSAVYSHSIETTRARLRAAATLRPAAHAPSAAPASALTAEQAPDPNAPREDGATVMLPAAELRQPGVGDSVLPDGPADGAAADGGGLFSGLPWGRLVLAMLTVFALAVGYLTIAEIGLGRSVAAVLNGEEGNGTTLSRVVDPSPSDSTDSNEDQKDEQDGSRDSDATESSDPEPSSQSDPTDDSTSDEDGSAEPTESSSPTSDSSADPSDAPTPESGGEGATAQPGSE